MKLLIEKPGLLTTVQDLGRRGHQMRGVPVAGAMDAAALRLGNILVGNEKGSSGLEPAGLEVTVLGPSIRVLEGEGCFAVTGAETGVAKNGAPVPCWTALKIAAGDVVAFSAFASAGGCSSQGGARSYFCVTGGIDVPIVMNSRSTYTRGKFGGHEGRALKAGDTLVTGERPSLWAACEGLECPPRLRPVRNPSAPLRAIPGPQDDLFTEEGLSTFYSSGYVITNSADRMGFRLEGPLIEHKNSPDIISDAICLGSVQVPGHGQPIVMLADRQTTGGYTKIATVCTVDVENLAQRLPGGEVRFVKITANEAADLLRQEENLMTEMRRLRAAWRSRPQGSALRGALTIRVDGKPHQVEWEKLN
ncbi:MAG: biotin-dependent carboxyltransferase family protein [Synergistaceae bacterium]|jgi:biotin-dependent carboxylase-like uncharacterized protein|nr:biotin-dependent carboxyltransferase family protein [Synergistaceae bacterium]